MKKTMRGIILIELKSFTQIERLRSFLDEHEVKISAEFLMKKKEVGCTKVYIDGVQKDFVLAYCVESHGSNIFYTSEFRKRLLSLKPLIPAKKYSIDTKENNPAAPDSLTEDFIIKKIENGKGLSDVQILDFLLDKIKNHGLNSLTKYERLLLKRFS